MQLHTTRLILRDWRLSDFEDYWTMVNDQETIHWTDVKREAMDREAAWLSMATLIGHKALRGYSLFAVEEKETGRMIGRVGPWYPQDWPALEVGWTTSAAARGKGYAVEAARASMIWTFETYKPERIISLVEPENVASRRVAERIGETVAGEETVHGKRCLVYAITHADAMATDWYRNTLLD